MSCAAATAFAGAVGAGATAQPGGEPKQLTPPAQLAANGGVGAPADGGSGAPAIESGGVEAPSAPEAAPPPEPDAQPTPGSPEPADAQPPAEPQPPPAPGQAPASEPPAGDPVELASDGSTSAPSGESPAADALTEAEVFEAREEPLVPVVVLSPHEPSPLVDIDPEELDAPALGTAAQEQDEQVPEGDQQEEQVIIIPVPPEDIVGEGRDEPDDAADAAPEPPARALPLTGRSMGPALSAAFLLLFLGSGLRLTSAGRARA